MYLKKDILADRMKAFSWLLLASLVLFPFRAMSDTSQTTLKIWGWFSVDASDRVDAIEEVMSTLSGTHYSIRYIHRSNSEEPATVLVLPDETVSVLEGIAKKRAGGHRDSPKEGKEIIHYVRQGYEAVVFEAIRLLDLSGYLSYVHNNVDLFMLVGNIMKCPLKTAQCLGGSRCDFVKAVVLSLPGLKKDPLELALLVVHEAAHLERCYDEEEYSWSKEEDFKSALYARRMHIPEENVMVKVMFHISSLNSEPTPLEDFTPAFIIEPKRVKRGI